jgi:outer membrane protein OmpA-like peptidoglycan-associated protein
MEQFTSLKIESEDGMTFKIAAVSLVALGLFLAPAVAQDNQAQPAAEQPVEVAAPPPLSDVALALINDRRTSQELSDDELKKRARQARGLLKGAGLPDDIKGQIQALMDADRAELELRSQAQKPAEPVVEPPVQEAAPEPKVEQPVQEAAPEPKVEQPVQEAAPEPKIEEPVQQAEPEPKIEEPAIAPQPEAQPVQEAAPEPAPVVEQPVEAKAAEPAAAPAPVVDKVEAKELDGNAGNPEAEKKAAAFLDDTTPADSLNDEALRARLDGMRDVMAENELSQKTERALRNKLRTEREVLRDRVTKAKAEDEAKAAAKMAAEEKKKQQAATDAGQPAPKANKGPNINIIITADTPVREILRDRREADALDESELRYRIRARRDFEASQQFRDYDEEQRTEWRQRTRRDREFLGRRLQEDRNIRRVELAKPANIRRLVIEDSADFAEDDIPEDVFAAEVEDADIERALLAPPRRKITRKIRVEDIATQPKVRASMTRIEVDTIRFGFNEAFVREEEVDNLDQIASIIERVLKKYPREVFLIEGHTDAVGSDAYNDKLSKARAEAVKKALSTYYIIPSKNLKTVGLGERYLKIPTSDQEQENRRVSISRATAVVGEAED